MSHRWSTVVANEKPDVLWARSARAQSYDFLLAPRGQTVQCAPGQGR